MKWIGIVGTRRRDNQDDYVLVHQAFRRVWSQGDKIVSGGCPRGGDRFAELIAGTFLPDKILRIHYPDTSKLDPVLLKVNPKAAWALINYARNTLVANDADILIACVAPDRKGGTEDTIKKFCAKYCKSDGFRSVFSKAREQRAVAAGVLILV
jgi:hypothetical protein